MIGKILIEINRLKNELDGYSAREALDYIESYINTLSKQQEQPSENLEAEIDSVWNKASGFSPKFITLEVKRNGLGVIARHFANWQKEQMPMPEDTVIFQKGIEEGKRLMMEDAEECDLYWDGDFLAIDLNMVALGYSERDKVKIIIIPEKEDKE